MKRIRFALIALVIISFIAIAPIAQVNAQSTLPSQCTGFQLQNPSTTATATGIQIEFYKVANGTGTPTYTFSLPDLTPNSSKSFYVPSYAGFSTVASGAYSVVVSSGAQLNVLANQTTCTGTPLVLTSNHGINSTDTGTIVYLPWINSRVYSASWSSSIAVQNAGTGDTSVLLEFFKPGSSASVKSFTSTVKQGETWLVDLSSGTYAVTELSGFAGAVKITSTSQPVAAIVTYAPSAGNKLLSYNGVTTGSQKLYAPQVNKVAYAGVYTSGLTLYNPNSTDTPIKIDYIAAGASTPTYSQVTSIPANNVFIQYLGNLASTNLPNGFNGTAVVSVTSGTNKIFGVANIDSNAGQSEALNMIPIEQAATTIYMPQIVHYNPTDASKYQSGWQVVNTSDNTLTLSVEYWNSTDTTAPTFTDTKTLAPGSALTNYVGSMSSSQVPFGFNGGVIIKVTSGSGSIVGQANFVNNLVKGDPLSIYTAFPPQAQ